MKINERNSIKIEPEENTGGNWSFDILKSISTKGAVYVKGFIKNGIFNVKCTLIKENAIPLFVD